MKSFKNLIRHSVISPLSLCPGVGLSLLMLCFVGCCENNCAPWENAICQDTAGFDGLMYGECLLEVNAGIVSVTYTCGSNSALGSARESEIACYDPATSIEDWRKPEWGILLYVLGLNGETDCDGHGIGEFFYEVRFDALSDGVPLSEASYDLSIKNQYSMRGYQGNCQQNYELVSGELVITGVSADNYGFEFHDLKFVSESGEVLDEDGCFLPAVIEIGSVSSTCVPESIGDTCEGC